MTKTVFALCFSVLAFGQSPFPSAEGDFELFKKALEGDESILRELAQTAASDSNEAVQRRAKRLLAKINHKRLEIFLLGDLSGKWRGTPEAQTPYEASFQKVENDSAETDDCAGPYHRVEPPIDGVVIGVCVGQTLQGYEFIWFTSGLERRRRSSIVAADFANKTFGLHGASEDGTLQLLSPRGK